MRCAWIRSSAGSGVTAGNRALTAWVSNPRSDKLISLSYFSYLVFYTFSIIKSIEKYNKGRNPEKRQTEAIPTQRGGPQGCGAGGAGGGFCGPLRLLSRSLSMLSRARAA